jgi:hypothetical protein
MHELRQILLNPYRIYGLSGPHAFPSYYVFLNGTALNCINIKYEKQKNI